MNAVKRLGSGRRLLAWPLVALGTLGFAASASAATYTVTTTADSNDGSCTASKCSLRDAVVAADQAGGASTIAVPAGVYKLRITPQSASGCYPVGPACDANDPTHGDLDIDKNAVVTVAGAGAGSTVINANSIDRAFAVQQGSSLALSKLKIENGEANPYSTSPNTGGAVYSDGTLTVNDSTLDQNSADLGGDIYADTDARSTRVTSSVLSHSFAGASGSSYGGAIYLAGGTLTINKDAFDNDRSYDNAGALYLDSGQATSITDSSFLNGNAGYGGSIDDDNGALTVSGSTFTNNSASTGNGGALLLDQTSGDVSITRSTFSGNSVLDYGYGGAIDLDPGATVSTRIAHSVFSKNEGGGYGGAIYYNDGSALSISRSWLTSNNSNYGAGVYADSSAGTLAIDHSTLDHNSAAYVDGGGLYLDNSSTTTVSNTTLSYNQAGLGGGIYFNTNVPVKLTSDTIAHNDAGAHGTCGTSFAPTDCGGGIYQPSDASAIVNTIVADNAGGDCDVAAGSADQGYNLDSDGSCFPTSGGTPEAPGDKTANPRLGPLQDNGGPAPTELPRSGSPAINAGNNAACPPNDERGVPRPQPPGGTCDIGAVEVAAASLTLTKHAPHRVTQGNAFTYKIRVSNAGPGPSTGTVVVDKLPKGETLYAATPSQGTCTASGTPTKVVCDLGTVNSPHTGAKAGATITLLVSEANAGQVVNRAHVHDDQGSSASASAQTKVVAAAAHGRAPTAITGQAEQLSQHSARLNGRVKPGGQPTSYFFQFRRPRSSAWSASAIRHTASSPESVSVQVSGLRAGSTYEFRLVATNDNGTSFGATRRFRTKGQAKRKHATRKPAHRGSGFAG